jgi:hypothetical protein
MKNIIIAVLLAGCGANAAAIKAAEKKCLAADEASLKAKLAQGIASESDAAHFALQLTLGELECAAEALGATAGSGSGSAQ